MLIDKSAEVTSLRLPCGLCASHECMQYTRDAASVPGCPAWLEKKSKRVFKPRHMCRVVGSVEYNQKSAKNSTQSAPCTNHLIMCPECPAAPMPQYFWKLRFQNHWASCHGARPIRLG